VNPLDVLTAPPALLKRALDDLHEIAELVRRYTAMEDDLLARVQRLEDDLGAVRAAVGPLSGQLASLETEIVGTRRAAEALPAKLDDLEDELSGVQTAVDPLRGQLTALAAELAPIQNLEPIRRGIEPLAQSMVSVRESVDELEPMIEDLDKKIQLIEPRLAEMQDSVEPIGDLAERIPGNRRRRQT
jgi:chromosome segregation ATPase